MAFVLDVNLRIRDILGLQKVEAALGKLQGAAHTSTGVAGGTGAVTSVKAQSAAATTQAMAISSVTTATNKMNVAQRQAATSTQKASIGMQVGSTSAKGFGESVYLAGRRYAAFVTATAAPLAILAGLGKATATVIEFDTAILKLRQIMGQTAQEITGIRDTILDLATSTGTSASEIANIGKILAQAGQRGDVLTESLTALSMVPLTPSFDTINSAVEGSIAALNQFNQEGLTTTKVLDVMTALSNKFAASAEDIAKGTARGGAAFEAIGGTYQEFAAVFTTVRQATRESAETVGTFMKTLSSRLADPKIVNFLEGKGIKISEAIEAGNPVEAIKRITESLKNVASIQDKMEIGTRLVGRRQISRLQALISNADVLDDTLKTAAASSGAFGKVAAEGLEGLQAQINIMVQDWNKLVQSLAAPVFVPIIKMATIVGKSLASMADFAKPIIPAFTYIVGFAGAFKLLALSIGQATKALTFMNTVGATVGGGLAAAATGAQRLASGAGVAGISAKERVQRRMAGGVGMEAGAAGAAGGRFAGVAKNVAASPLTQLAVAAGIALAANKFSESAEKAGNSAGVFASEAVNAAAIIGIAISVLSGKSIAGAFAALGPFGGAVAGVTLALGALAYAAYQAAEIDMQEAIDEITNKIKNIKVDDMQLDTPKELQQQVGKFGKDAMQGLQAAANTLTDNWFDVFHNILFRIKNMFSGQGNVDISDAKAQEILNTIVGSNPELLNKILQSAIQQFGAGGLETGIDQMFIKAFGGHAEVASRLRQAMIKQLGGTEKIVTNLGKTKIDAEVSKLSNAIAKASIDFDKIHVPSQLAHELTTLSDVVSKTARAIQNNVQLFDKLSQGIGQDISIPRPETKVSTKSIEKIIASGKIGEIINVNEFEKLAGFSTDMAMISSALTSFGKSVIKSQAASDKLRTLLQDPKISPFEIADEFVDNFLKKYPIELSSEAKAKFKTGATSMMQQLQTMVNEFPEQLFDEKEITKMMDSVLGKQQPLHDASVKILQQWIETQLVGLGGRLGAEEQFAKIDVGTATLGATIIESLQDSLKHLDIDFNIPTWQNTNDAILDTVHDVKLLEQVMQKFHNTSVKQAGLLRQIEEGDYDTETFKAFEQASTDLGNAQAAFSQLLNLIKQAPEVLAKIHEKERESPPDIFSEEFADQQVKKLATHVAETEEYMTRWRQFTEAKIAADVSQVFREPANLFAKALRESATAVQAFTTALTIKDIEQRRGGATAKSKLHSPGKQAEGMDKQFLQSALFGGDINSVVEALRKSAAEVAGRGVPFEFIKFGRTESASQQIQLVDSFKNFEGSSDEILRAIRDSGLNLAEVSRGAADLLREQAAEPGALEVEHIGALQRPIGDLVTSLKTLIKNPALARQPQHIIDQLPTNIQNLLRNLGQPVDRTTEPEVIPRVFEDITASANDFRTGGTDILLASQGMTEAIGQLHAFVDIQRETLAMKQEVAAGEGVGNEGTREAISATTEAVNALGERIDLIAKAVETQTQQETELATSTKDKYLKVEGLAENTEVIGGNNEIASQTKDSMTTLNEGISQMAGAMQKGIGIDIETMSDIKVDVQGIGMAAKEFTAEFEALAHNVAKEEIRLILQQLARAAGSPEAASTFESAIT